MSQPWLPDAVPEPAIRELSAAALAAYREGKSAQAEHLCRRILDVDNLHSEALALFGSLHAERGDFANAVQLLERSLQINEAQPAAATALGDALRALRRHAEAASTYDQAIALAPNEPDLHRKRSAALLEIDRLDEALSSADTAIACDPESPESHVARGDVLRRLGRHQDALSSYDRAIALKPNDAAAYRHRGLALAALGRFNDAAVSYDRSIEIEANNPEAYKFGGDLCLQHNLFEHAVAFYGNAIQLKPDYAAAYAMRAYAFRCLKRDDEARASLDRAIELDPELRPTLERMLFLKTADRLVGFGYSVIPAHRWGETGHPRLAEIIAAGNARYRTTAAMFMRYAPQLRAIERVALDPAAPQWMNSWLSPVDAIALYGFVASKNPKRYIEIGSGVSTKFARRAITDHSLRTQIVSIDPAPRSQIDVLCDQIVRSRLEAADLSLFDGLTDQDIVFFDGSHRAFQNSDVTVFFLEVLPRLRGGPLIGVHDIYLPRDYPSAWLQRFYNEQYLLACWLLSSDRIQIELPVRHVVSTPELKQVFDPLLSDPMFAGTGDLDNAFWFRLL